MRIPRRIARFAAEDDGPTAVEYAVMLAAIIFACVVVVTTIGSIVSRNFNNADPAHAVSS